MKTVCIVLYVMIVISILGISIGTLETQEDKPKPGISSRIFMYEYDETYKLSPNDSDEKIMAIVTTDSSMNTPPNIIIPNNNTSEMGTWKRIDNNEN